MSLPRTKFEAAVKNGKWQDAFLNLNALSMQEMLASLSSLPAAKLDKLIQRRFAYKSGVDMPRMEYAWTVVKTRNLPLIAPGDLSSSGQVGTAAQFLKKPIMNTRIGLNITVFTDSIVQNRTLFPELVAKAGEILRSQGDRFALNVTLHKQDIPYQEVIYLESQLAEMAALAKKTINVPVNHLVVLQVRVKANVGVHGIAALIDGRRVVVIDTDSPNPDRATLLHEIGHCAGLPHAGAFPTGSSEPVDVGDATNVMAEPISGIRRSNLTVTQGEYLAKAFFTTQ
jgi:hypothetical protein